jgi:metallo-beta-lactamase class B
MTTLDSAAPDAWFRLEPDRLELGGAWTIAASARLDRDLRGLKAEGGGPYAAVTRRNGLWFSLRRRGISGRAARNRIRRRTNGWLYSGIQQKSWGTPMKLRLGAAAAALLTCMTAASAQAPAPGAVDALLAAAKRASGLDYAGTFQRICVAPDNMNSAGPGRGGAGRGAGAAPAARAVPDRATWYAGPYKVFDNLYFIGTKVHSAWALTTSQGIIVIDSLYDYAIEPEMVEGLTKLGLNPRDVKYMFISHAHGDHDQGAALFQSRYGTKIVMGGPDWDSTLTRPANAPGGVPKKDISVGPEGTKITLGDTTVDVIFTPGHTPGTISYIFPVKDGRRTLTVAYNGGTAFNFPRATQAFANYRDVMKRMGAAVEKSGATVLMTNHTEFDRAYDRVRLAQIPRAAGEKHIYESDAATVRRYFELTETCAEAQRLVSMGEAK